MPEDRPTITRSEAGWCLNGRLYSVLPQQQLVDLAIRLSEELALLDGATSAGFVRRELMAKPKDERSPGAVAMDVGAVG